jgi:hypothetical protein
MSEKQDWRTPRSIFDPLHAEFNFTLDAAASADNSRASSRSRIYTPRS